MKLDRNVNKDGTGKYALIKLREIEGAQLVADVRHARSNPLGSPTTLPIPASAIDLGDEPDTEFFVIRLKDKYAGPALHAYAQSARFDDEEYAGEIDALAQAADRRMPKRIPD